ncbi:VOC family protein [Nocardia vinacea]|uniref:VOC family protein n=1 Tax=Nocardia vinacea TaxID=96468 RepID=UPI0033E19260
MAFNGYSHIGLTVTDLDRSCTWYTEVLEWKELARGHGETTTFAHGVLPGGMSLVLRQHDRRIEDRFDEAHVGLDHLSFSVETMADLDELEERLAKAGAEFTTKRELPFGWLLDFRDPDNIALEAMLGR